MSQTALQRPAALASALARGSADLSTTTTQHDEGIAWPVSDVVVDLSRAEPPDVCTAVDLAQPDPIACDVARSRAATH